MAMDPELIDPRLQQFFPTLQTPTHPPYSSMIRQALLKLNEECGSSEEDISRFLEKEFDGLPWAHASLLSHHLEKLCDDGQLLRVGNARYMLNVDDGDSGKEDRALVQGKGCEVERQSVEASHQKRACEQRIVVFEEQIESRRESIEEVQEKGQNFSGQVETSHQFQIVCINTEHDMVQVDDGDLRNEKEDRTLVQAKEIEVEAINCWSGANGDRGAESMNRCGDETHSTEVSGQNKASERILEGFEEHKEGRMEPLKEVQEESRNFSGKIVVDHRFEKHGEIGCPNSEGDMVHMDGEMSHQLSMPNRDEKQDRTLVQVKAREVEAIYGQSGVNDDQAADSGNRCEDETHSMEVSCQNKAGEQRTEGFEEQNEGRRESLENVREESRNFSGQIELAEEVDVAIGKVTKVARNRRGQKRKRQQKTKRLIKVIHVKAREVEDINGRSGVNSDQAADSGNQCEDDTHNVEVSGQHKALDQRTEGYEEQNEGRREPLKEVREGCRNFSGQIEVAEEVDVATGKLTKVARKQRGLKRKRQQKTKRQIKVLKEDIPQRMTDEEHPQKLKRESGVNKSAGEQELPRRSKMIGEQGCPHSVKIDTRNEMPVFSCDGEDVKVFTTSPPKRSVRLLEKQKKGGSKQEEVQERKLHERERGLFIVCALPASRPRTSVEPKANTLLTDSTSASHVSREWGDILLRQLKRSSRQRRRRPADLRGNTSDRFTQSEPKQNGTSKNLGLGEKQEERFHKPEKPGEYEVKTKQENVGGEGAEVKTKQENVGGEGAEDSIDEGHQTKRIKVYVRRNARKSQPKEAGNSNILSSNSD